MTDGGDDAVQSEGNWNIIHTGGGIDGAVVVGDNNQLAMAAGNDIAALWGNSNDVWLGTGVDQLTGRGDRNNVYAEHNPALFGGSRAPDAVKPGTATDDIAIKGSDNTIDDGASIGWRVKRLGQEAWGALPSRDEVLDGLNEFNADYRKLVDDVIRNLNR